MRIIAYTVVQMQSSVLVVDWQVVAPNGLFAAITSVENTHEWPLRPILFRNSSDYARALVGVNMITKWRQNLILI